MLIAAFCRSKRQNVYQINKTGYRDLDRNNGPEIFKIIMKWMP